MALGAMEIMRFVISLVQDALMKGLEEIRNTI